MFTAIYQAYLKPGREEVFHHYWKIVATYFIQNRGAIGSCLHRGKDGLWLAYSRWPTQAMRDASWPGEQALSEELPDEILKAISEMKNCIDSDRKIPDMGFDVVEDLLIERSIL